MRIALASLVTVIEAARLYVAPDREPIDDADFVVLAVDPMADPANFANVRCAIRNGRLIHLRSPAAGIARE